MIIPFLFDSSIKMIVKITIVNDKISKLQYTYRKHFDIIFGEVVMVRPEESIKSFEPLWGNWYADELLGEGGYGRVYRLVRHDSGGTFYSACKHIVIPKNDTEIQNARAMGMDNQSTYTYFNDIASRILNEINIMYALRGESNIVTYEDHYISHEEGSLKWDVFIRMELLVPLASYIADNPMEPEEVRRLGIEICSALEACAAYKIIHRDIKEGNIFLNPRGTFKLGDFGIARELSGGNMSMSMRGTPSYVAPEIYNGKPYDATVDLYSLGILMYKLLNNNRYPFFPPLPEIVTVESSEQAFALRMQGGTPAQPVNGDDSLRSAVMKAICFDPRQRFQSASEMKTALLSRSVVDIPAAVQPPVAASAGTFLPPQAQQSQSFPQSGGYTYAPQQQTYAPQQQAYAPQQQAYAQQQTYAPQQQAYAPYVPQQTQAGTQHKKANTGLVLGIIGGIIIIVALLAVLIGGNLGASDKYVQALTLEASGDYTGALNLFSDVKRYKDSNDHINALQIKLADEYLAQGDALSAASAIDAVNYNQPTDEQSAELLYYQIRVNFAQAYYDEAFAGLSAFYSSQLATDTYENRLMDDTAVWMTKYMSPDDVLSLESQYSNNRTALKLIDYGAYAKASTLLSANHTADAKALFDSLGMYEDATDMSKECVYRDAQTAFDAEDYAKALTLFDSLSTYSDAAERANFSLYHLACELFLAGDYETAFADFQVLPSASFVPDDSFLYDNTYEIYLAAQHFYYMEDYGNAQSGFDVLSQIGGYERSGDYLALCAIHIAGVTEYDLDTLVPLIGFEDASSLLLSNIDIAQAFLLGKWTCSDGSLEFTDTQLIYGLSAPDFGDKWNIENGTLYFFDSSDTSNRKDVYHLEIEAENKISCYAYKNDKTYTLKRK